MKRLYLFMAGVLIITFIVLLTGWGEIYEVINRMSFLQLIIMFSLQLGTLFLSAFIWFYLLKQKSSTITMKDVFTINLAGTFVESVTPSVKIGGESLKVYLMKKKTLLTYPELTAVAVVSKFYSLLPFLVISIFTITASFLFYQLPGFVYLAFIGFILFFLLFFIFFVYDRVGRKRVSHNSFFVNINTKIKKIHEFIAQASKNSTELARDLYHQRVLLFGLSSVVWAFYPIKVYLVALILGYQINPIIVVVAIYTAYLVSMVPFLPGGLATFEGTLALILTHGGLSFHESFAIALMTRVITFWFPLIISAFITIYLVQDTGKKKVLLVE